MVLDIGFWLHCCDVMNFAWRRQYPSISDPKWGRALRDYLDMAVEAEALGYRSSFLVEHYFTGWNQVSATLMLQTALAMRTTKSCGSVPP